MKHRSVLYLCTALFFAVLIHPSFGQTNTPEAAAEKYYDAFYAGQWEKLAELAHPDALSETAAFVKELANSNKSTRASMTEDFAGYFSIDTIDRVSSRMIYAVFNQVMMSKPIFKEMLDGSKVTILGSVKEGENDAHVVARMRVKMMGDTFNESLEIQSFRLHDGKWLALLSEDFEVLKSTLAMFMGLAGDDDDDDDDWEAQEEGGDSDSWNGDGWEEDGGEY